MRSSATRVDGVDRFLMSIARLAGFVAVLSLGYLLFVLFSPAGYVSAPERFSSIQQAAIAQRVGYASRGFAAGVVILLAALIYRSRSMPELQVIYAVAGLALALGGPSLVHYAMGSAQPGWTSQEIARTFRALGAICLGAAAVYALLDVVDRLRARRARERTEDAIITSPRRVRELAEAGKPLNRFLGKCWNLPYCRPAMKPHCPIFQRHQQPCWRIGVGCMCSEEVLLIAARNEGFDVAWGSAGQPGGLMVLPTVDQVAGKLTRRQKSARCGRCAIYLHHQEQKYRAAVWVALAAVAGVVFLGLPLWHRLYVQVAVAAERVTRTVALPMPTKPEEQHPGLQPWVGRLPESTFVEWILILCVAILFLTYLLRLVEFVIYRLRW
jgi:hypothetical protein